MFEGIDDIDWGNLTHAYGSADDVPALLRSLASPDEKTRKDAIYELFGNIWHQGTVYEATIYAVPYLVELLASPETEDKSSIACLLASIADGYGYLEVHAQPESFESDWRSILAKQGKHLETEMANELATTNRVREAAKIALPVITPFLRDSEPETRGSVALALSRYPEFTNDNLPLLVNALDKETESETRDTIQEAIDRLKAQETA